jgi:hypothetical protein
MTERREGPETAEEFAARLEADPEWVAAREREDAEDAAWEAEYTREEAPVVAALAEVGIHVGSVWDLVNTAEPYPVAYDVLLEHLGRPYRDRIRDSMARALAVRDARSFWERLRRLYEEEPAGTETKDGLAVALSAVANASVLDEVIELVGERAHGDSRLLMLDVLARSRQARARDALEAAADDPGLETEATRLLRRRR